jgi:hypothetical protein
VSEFSWWLLILGLVAGAGLVWLVLADSTRREAEVEERELPAEAAWIAESMAEQGRPIDTSDAEEVLRLHRSYLGVPPPDEPPAEPVDAAEPAARAPIEPPADRQRPAGPQEGAGDGNPRQQGEPAA